MWAYVTPSSNKNALELDDDKPVERWRKMHKSVEMRKVLPHKQGSPYVLLLNNV
jgi:hypothetical protein